MKLKVRTLLHIPHNYNKIEEYVWSTVTTYTFCWIWSFNNDSDSQEIPRL